MPQPPSPRSLALRFVVLLGVVSLFSDMTHEGARSIAGPFLASLGASAVAISAVAGLGEFMGQGLRLLTGYLADRTRRYWTLVFVGYALNLFAVPLLALADQWEWAAVLLVTERTGRAIRTPARDVLLSQAAQPLGRGRAFGIYEALDQVGAVLGPLLVAAVFAARGEYGPGFAVLLAPALLAFLVLVMARRLHPRAGEIEAEPSLPQPRSLPRAFWVYLAAMALLAAGFADFPLVAFHLSSSGTVPTTWIPLLYALAMGTDALAALALGEWYDRKGISILVAVAFTSALTAPLVFLGGMAGAVGGMVLWGVGMGALESVVRAAVADMVPAQRRGLAYGIFAAGFGLSWLAGSVLLGVLYERSLPLLVGTCVTLQLAAVLPLLVLSRGPTSARSGT